jgi:hypothetical protein
MSEPVSLRFPRNNVRAMKLPDECQLRITVHMHGRNIFPHSPIFPRRDGYPNQYPAVQQASQPNGGLCYPARWRHGGMPANFPYPSLRFPSGNTSPPITEYPHAPNHCQTQCSSMANCRDRPGLPSSTRCSPRWSWRPAGQSITHACQRLGMDHMFWGRGPDVMAAQFSGQELPSVTRTRMRAIDVGRIMPLAANCCRSQSVKHRRQLLSDTPSKSSIRSFVMTPYGLAGVPRGRAVIQRE